VPALANAQANLPGIEVSVIYGERGNSLAELGQGGAKYVPVQGGISSALMAESSGERPTIIHLHGLWDPLLHSSASFARKQRLLYIVSTRGMLADWALRHKALKKKIGWWLYQRRDLQQSDCLLASSAFEEDCIRRLVSGNRIEVIPNGCHDRPELDGSESGSVLNIESRWALALGRLHPVKGYAELIDAWAAVKPEGWKLAIAGPDEDGYQAVLEQRIRSHGLEGQVVLLGEVDDTAKWPLLDQCELFLAPSHTENFGMAIAEALQSGKPVLTTRGTPWQELQQLDCGWWVEPQKHAIENALRKASDLSSQELMEMGERGRQLIRNKYSWKAVAERVVELYRSIMSGQVNEV
jgi:glycosyltransferase involved in cell wall biosynthesis